MRLGLLVALLLPIAPVHAGWQQDARALHAAAESGDAAKIARLLDAGADVDAVLEHRTALQQAVRHNQLAAAKLLHQRGATLEPMAPGEDGALHLAAGALDGPYLGSRAERPALLDWLLTSGAAVGARGHDGATALHFAARIGRQSACERLLAAGADLNAVDDHGETPLDWSASLPWASDLPKWLCARGATGGHQAAAALRDMALLRAWLERRGPRRPGSARALDDLDGDGPKPSFGDRLPMSPLLAALRHGWLEGARYLLEQGEPLAISYQSATDYLVLAITTGDLDLVRLVLSYGANPEPMRADEHEPAMQRLLRTWKPLPLLFEPAARGDLAALDRALAAGAPPNRRDRYGQAPLHLAAEQCQVAIVERLLAKGALLDARDYDWRTPLFAAAEHGQREVVALLLARGADPALPDFHGDTPARAAQRGGHGDIAAILATRSDSNHVQ